MLLDFLFFSIKTFTIVFFVSKHENGRSSLSSENDNRYFLNIGCSCTLVSSLMAD